MKKSLLIASAALFAASNAFAVDLYVVGNDVNGAIDWDNGSKMTETSTNVFEWSGSSLGKGFKINNGGWSDAAYNIGGDGSLMTVGTAYTYITGEGSQDIKFNGGDIVTNPKMVLDMNTGKITVTGTLGEAETPEPGEVTFYMIGSNVNGKSWALAEADCAFTDKGNGIYEWDGQVLGTGFKINDGTWSNEAYNIGSTGAELSLDVPYYYSASGSSGNIAFAGFTELANPHVVLNLNEQTIVVSGNAGGEAHWYIAGINGVFELTEEWELFPVEGQDGVFQGVIEVVEQSGEFKISDTGWAHELGTNTPEEVFITPDILSIVLDDVVGEGGNVPYELVEGIYTVTFDYNEYTLTFSAGDDAVDAIFMDSNAKAEYYNLHGMKVANPDKGIFIKVVNGKALKVVM